MNITLTLPDWVHQEIEKYPKHILMREERMKLVIRLSQLNFVNKTGGPFAAAVFERNSGKIVSVGVNRVVPLNCSSAHAEVVALSMAQNKLQTFDLGSQEMPVHELVVNWRPCAMCYGAVLWSGVRSLVIAGSDDTVEKITGFDEGPIHPDWIDEFKKRGIDVLDNVLRDEACAVFREFAESGSPVYNGRGGDTES